MYLVILVTVKNLEEAKLISNELVSEHLAACVNIVDKVHSIFWWEGDLNEEQEVLLVIKTKQTVIDEVISKVKELHSYDVPEIIALPIKFGNEEYLKWIDESVES